MKSYKLLCYLNRQHSHLERYLIGYLSYFGVYSVTQSHQLAKRSYEEMKADLFFTGFRRASWYASRGWPPGFELSQDVFFFASESMDIEGCQSLLKFHHERPESSLLTWLDQELGLRAGYIHAIINKNDTQVAKQELESIKCNVDHMLKLLADLFNVRKIEQRDVSNANIKSISSAVLRKDFSKKNASIAISDLIEVLPLDRWPWFVINGTFLGLQREGGFLEHDMDIDIGIYDDNLKIDYLCEILNSADCFSRIKVDYQLQLDMVGGQLSAKSIPVLIKLVHKAGVSIDISILYTENDMCWHGSPIHRWEHQLFDLDKRVLGGVTVLAPMQADRYLTEAYGDWRTPVVSFNCSTGSPNLRLVRNPLSLALFMRRLHWHLNQSDISGYKKILNQLLSEGVIQIDSCNPPTLARNWISV